MKTHLDPVDKKELKEPDSDIYYINWYMIYQKYYEPEN